MIPESVCEREIKKGQYKWYLNEQAITVGTGLNPCGTHFIFIPLVDEKA
jgi:hypothetical protein